MSALDGIKVVECCELVAGPYCGKLLADLGAEVIKIESPAGGDKARRLPPFPGDCPGAESSGTFLHLNTNKKSLTLNLERRAGRRIFEDLVRQADILVTDFTSRKANRLGMRYDKLSAVNPALVMVSVTPFGQTGPYKDYEARPINTWAAGGVCYPLPHGEEWMRRPERGPVTVWGYAGEFHAGLVAASGCLLGYISRSSSGKGVYIDVSKQDALMSMVHAEIVRFPNEGFLESRKLRTFPVGGEFECSDGKIVQVLPLKKHEWDALMRFLGNPEWSRAEIFQGPVSIMAHSEEANELLRVSLAGYTADQVCKGAQAEGCPAAVVLSPGDLFESEQLKARNFFRTIEHPVVGPLLYPSAAYKLSSIEFARNPATLLGQYNEEILCGRLGLAKEMMVKLRERGII